MPGPDTPQPPPAQAPGAELCVDRERLQADIEALASIGRREDHGIHRLALTDAWFTACDWLATRARDAGLEVRIDEALNVCIRLGDPSAPAVITGSHIDSVPGGGHLDGALGVLAGLEALRRLKETGAALKHPVELIAFTDEEGRFGGMLGSQAISGQLTPESILGARDLDGIAFVDVMKERGLDALHLLRASRKPQDVRAFVELHIEQGPVLDMAGIELGIVEGINGLFKWDCHFKGQANHAGTTPMTMRADAFQGLAEFAGEIDRVLEEDGDDSSRATIGRVTLGPGAANVVPAVASFSLDVRSLDPDVLTELALGLRKAASAIARRRGLMFEYEVLSEIDPVRCDKGILAAIEAAAESLGAPTMRLPSGAAHDAQMMADLGPVGMIFVPSKDGRSHTPAEWTQWQAIGLGADALLRTLHSLANQS